MTTDPFHSSTLQSFNNFTVSFHRPARVLDDDDDDDGNDGTPGDRQV